MKQWKSIKIISVSYTHLLGKIGEVNESVNSETLSSTAPFVINGYTYRASLPSVFPEPSIWILHVPSTPSVSILLSTQQCRLSLAYSAYLFLKEQLQHKRILYPHQWLKEAYEDLSREEKKI